MSEQTFTDHNDLQRQVAELLGRCIIRLQRFELSLKYLLTTADIEVEASSSGTMRQRHRLQGDQDTLGRLIGKLLGSFILPDKPGFREIPDGGAAGHIRARWYVVATPQDHQRLSEDLADLLSLRNYLVHHFLADKDLREIDDCKNALSELTAAEAKIVAQSSYIAELIGDHDRCRAAMQEQLSQAPLRAMIAGGPIVWEYADIVADLREAERKLSRDGWTRLRDAVAFIAQMKPEQTPENYRCRSWPQVLDESRQFEVKKSKEGGIFFRSGI
ncbi:OST-HTH/LOTUS domain-containing protein [Falsigemmobacter intermedius]|uniref:HTH OST-type domain-containing protein n=1 Tax=Falsigemmobacter intermedius TaxID=1553448 RepID=A0A3S3UPE3_9RHOB|nr:OST-HTH/LOTUS domain-containing protein [Falsigemmobacter intermedius]RWY38196.1 hypothetical protein EP867_16540 [Falsigemmobacter intermedius]